MLQDETCTLYHIYSCLRYRAQNWVLTVLLSSTKYHPPGEQRLAFPQVGLIPLPDVLSVRVTLILSKQLKQAIQFFFSLLFAKTTHSFSSLIWAWQPLALGKKMLEGKQHIYLQPDESGISSCHGALRKPFTDLAGSSGVLRWVLPRALTYPRRINSLGWGCVWAKSPHCFPPSSTPATP